MPTIRSGFVVLMGFWLAACGGSVSEDSGSGGASGGGGASTGGSGAAGGFSGGGGGGSFCFHEGQSHFPGSTWTSADGCNVCHCSEYGGSVSCTKQECAGTCEYNGQLYKVGESFPAGDGCNTCSCNSNGKVACTLAFCAPACTYAGKQYAVGDAFPSIDGCNKCTCTDQGVSCTELACPCDPTKEWWRNYVGKSPQECMTIKYACTGYTTPFSNACGCGCEQDPSCPQTIDCMPPAPDCEKWKAKCPFSGVAY